MQRALAKMPGITSGSFRFYSSLLWDFHSSDTGLCCPSIEQASDNSGLSEKGARNAARALKNVGAIDYDKNTGGRSRPNYYIIKSLHGLPSLQDTWATRVPLKPGERNLAPIADFQGRKLGKNDWKTRNALPTHITDRRNITSKELLRPESSQAPSKDNEVRHLVSSPTPEERKTNLAKLRTLQNLLKLKQG